MTENEQMHEHCQGWHCLKLAYNAEGELNAEKELREGKAQLS